jgi:hypothetical protein
MWHRRQEARRSLLPVGAPSSGQRGRKTIMAGVLIKELLIRGDLINGIKSLLSG